MTYPEPLRTRTHYAVDFDSLKPLVEKELAPYPLFLESEGMQSALSSLRKRKTVSAYTPRQALAQALESAVPESCLWDLIDIGDSYQDHCLTVKETGILPSNDIIINWLAAYLARNGKRKVPGETIQSAENSIKSSLKAKYVGPNARYRPMTARQSLMGMYRWAAGKLHAAESQEAAGPVPK